MKNFLTQEEIKLLESKHRHCKEKRQADRIKTILYLNMGDDYKEIAKRLLLDDSTLRNYTVEYVEGGIEKLLSDDYSGGISRLSFEQMQQLDEHLQAHTYVSSKEIKAYIEKTFGKIYTTEGVKNILYRMGFSYTNGSQVSEKTEKVIMVIKLIKVIGDKPITTITQLLNTIIFFRKVKLFQL